jgi:hypothetical protein
LEAMMIKRVYLVIYYVWEQIWFLDVLGSKVL